MPTAENRPGIDVAAGVYWSRIQRFRAIEPDFNRADHGDSAGTVFGPAGEDRAAMDSASGRI